MSKGCIGGILNVLAVVAMMAIILTLGPNPLGIILSVVVGVGICFLDYWIYYGRKAISEKLQQYVICPRCNIPVEKDHSVCPKCNNKV
jgi:hypothetical protein